MRPNRLCSPVGAVGGGGFNGGWREELATARAKGSLRDAFPLPAGGLKSSLNNCYDSRVQRLIADYAEAHKQSRRFIVVKEGLGRIVEVSPQKGVLFAGRPEEGGWREGLATTRDKGSLRDAFPFLATGLPAKSQTNESLHGSRWERFFCFRAIAYASIAQP